MRRPGRLRGEQVVDAEARRVVAPGVVQPLQHQRALVRREDGERGRRRVHVGRGGVQQHGEVLQQPVDGGRVPQVGAEGEPAVQPLLPLAHQQAQVELGGVHPGDHRLHRHRPQPELLALGHLEREHHPEEGRLPHVALRVQLLHQLLEGDVLVPVRLQHAAAHLVQQLAEAPRRGEVGADHQRVGEEADEVLHLGPRPPGHRRPHQHVVLAAPAAQQHLPGGEQRHEERRPLGASHRAQPLHGPAGDADALHAPPRGGRRRGGAVGGQLQRGRGARQPPAPVAQLPLERRAAQPGALPGREVRVLHRQLGERRRQPLRVRRVQAGHLAHQHAHAPPVADDVVHGEQHHVLVVGQPQQPGAQQRPARQVEGERRLAVHQPRDLHVALRLRQRRQVRHRDGHRAGRQRGRHDAVVARAEHGAQHLVAAHHLGQGALQRGHVQRAADAHCLRDVVGGAPRLQLVDEPEPLLREGQLRRPLPRPPRDALFRRRRRPLAPQLLQQQRALRGRQPVQHAGPRPARPLRRRAALRVLPRALVRVGRHGRPGGLRCRRRVRRPHQQVLHHPGERGHRGRLEERAQRYVHPERLADAGHGAGGQQRVAAQVEEAGVHADPLQPEHLREDRRQRRLGGGPRRHVAPGARLHLRVRQRPPVHLAVGGQGKLLQHHHRGRHHVLRHPPAQVLPQLRPGNRLRVRRHVAHQPPVAPRVRADDDDGVAHRGVGGEDDLDFARLHAEAADLDLEVHPAQELQLAARVPAHPVARAVQPLARASRTRRGRTGRPSAPGAPGSRAPPPSRPRTARPATPPEPARPPGPARTPCSPRPAARSAPPTRPPAPPRRGARC